MELLLAMEEGEVKLSEQHDEKMVLRRLISNKRDKTNKNSQYYGFYLN